MMNLTPEQLQEMYVGQNKSMNEIARISGMPKGTIVSRLRRLRLRGLIGFKARGPAKVLHRPRKPVADKPKPVPVVVQPKIEMPIPVAPVSLLKVNDRLCRYPLDYKIDGFSACCGGEVVAGTPYCADHAGICFIVKPRVPPRGHRAIGE
jgi:hypothetical protein